MNIANGSDLPVGWARASLDEVCASITDGDHQAPPQVESGVPFLVIGNVRDGHIDFSDTRFVSESYFRSLAEDRKPSRGDVLYSVTGSFGIPVLVTTDRPFCVQRHIAILKPWSKGFARYLARALGTSAVFSQASSVATGTAQKTVGLKHLRKFTVPLAPIPEQQRIVEAIESYLTRLDDAVATLERVQRNLKRYRASVLKTAVEGRLVPTEAELARPEGGDYEPASVLLERILAERRRRWMDAGGRGKYQEPVAPDTTELPELPEGWCWATVDQVGNVSGGLTVNATRDGLPMRLPYLRVANVYADELRLDEVKDIGVDEAEIRRVLLEPGDLLVVEGNGSVDQIGRVALWHGAIRRCLHQNHLIKVRFEPVSLGRWSLLWLLSPPGRRVVEHVTSSTSGLHTLSLSKVAALPLPFCPLNEQARIAVEVDRLLSLSQTAADSLTTTSRRCARLRRSILKWAFEGKLADQDPSDEPATALLERINAEPQSPWTAKKHGRPSRSTKGSA